MSLVALPIVFHPCSDPGRERFCFESRWKLNIWVMELANPIEAPLANALTLQPIVFDEGDDPPRPHGTS
jgi:hypothetical protein